MESYQSTQTRAAALTGRASPYLVPAILLHIYLCQREYVFSFVCMLLC